MEKRLSVCALTDSKLKRCGRIILEFFQKLFAFRGEGDLQLRNFVLRFNANALNQVLDVCAFVHQRVNNLIALQKVKLVRQGEEGERLRNVFACRKFLRRFYVGNLYADSIVVHYGHAKIGTRLNRSFFKTFADELNSLRKRRLETCGYRLLVFFRVDTVVGVGAEVQARCAVLLVRFLILRLFITDQSLQVFVVLFFRDDALRIIVSVVTAAKIRAQIVLQNCGVPLLHAIRTGDGESGERRNYAQYDDYDGNQSH